MTSMQCRYFFLCKKRKNFRLGLIVTLAKQPALKCQKRSCSLTNRHVTDKLDSIMAFCFLLRHSHKKEGKKVTDQKQSCRAETHYSLLHRKPKSDNLKMKTNIGKKKLLLWLLWLNLVNLLKIIMILMKPIKFHYPQGGSLSFMTALQASLPQTVSSCPVVVFRICDVDENAKETQL